MAGINVGTVTVKVRPDTTGFRQRVEAAASTLRDVKVKVSPEFEDFDKEVARKSRDKNAKVKFEADFDPESLPAKSKAAASAASKFKVRFKTALDSSGAIRDALLTTKGIQHMLSQDPWKFKAKSLSLRELIDTAGVSDAIKAANSQLKIMGKTLSRLRSMKNVLRPSTRALGSFKAISKGIRDMTGSALRSIKVLPSLTYSLRGFVSLANVAGMAFGALAGGALATKAAIVGVGTVLGYAVDGLKQLSGAALLIPSLLGGITIAGLTGYAAFRGMGDALKAAVDPSADLEENIEGLAPSAQEFARSVRRVTPAWLDMQKNIQDVTFKGWNEALEKASAQQLPTLQSGTEKIAKSFNKIGLSIGKFAGSERTTKALERGFTATSKVMDNVAKSTENILNGLQDMGTVGLESLSKFSDKLPELAQKFADWTGDEKNQRKMSKWIDDSIQGFKDLGSTIGNLYSTTKEIGHAFGINFEGNAIGKFKELTDKTREWVGSADDANSRISKFQKKVEELSQPWQDFATNAWDKLVPAFQELTPFLTEASTQFADNMSSLVDWVAPKLQSLFSFISDNKDWLAPLVSGLLTFRAALGVFSLARRLAAPFLGLFTGAAGTIGKAMKGFKKAREYMAPDARLERKNEKAAKKQAKQEAKAQLYGARQAEKADKQATKTAKKEANKQSVAAEKAANEQQRVYWDSIEARGDKRVKDAKEARKVEKQKARDAKRAAKKQTKAARKSSRNIDSLAKGLGKRQPRAAGGKIGKTTKALGKFKSVAGKAGKVAGKVGRGLGSTAKVAGKLGKGLGTVAKIGGKLGARAIPFVGEALMIADAGMLIYNNWDKITGAASKAGDWFQKKFPKTAAAVSKAWDGMKDAGSKAWDSVSSWWDGLGPTWSDKWESIKSGVSGKWDDIKSAASSGWDNVKSKVGNVWNGVKESWSDKWQGIKDSVSEKWNGIKSGATEGWEATKTFLSDLWTGLGEAWSTAWEAVGTFLSDTWNAIKEGAIATWTGFTELLGTVWDGITDLWSTAWTNIGTWLSETWVAIQTAATTAWTGVTEFLGTVWDGIVELWTATWTNIGTSLSETWTGIQNAATTAWTGVTTFLGTVWDGVTSTWSSVWSNVSGTLSGIWSGISSTASSIFSSIGSTISSVWSSVSSTTSSIWSSISSTVSSTVSSMFSTISSTFSSIVSTVSSAMSSFLSSVTSGVSSAMSVISSIPGKAQAALGNVGSILVSSGKALIQGFINGIESMIDGVRTAVSKVVAAAGRFFPHSPAKEGPFSGKGYTTWSGKALAGDFAKGILSKKGDVVAATSSLMKDAQKQLNKPVEAMDKHQRKKILDPVLESNAEAIAKRREADRKAEERHQEQLKRIAESKSKDKAKRIAEADKKLAEDLEKNRKDLEESLEAPDYSDINLSFNEYWVEGTKDMLKDALGQAVSRAKIAEKMRGAALEGVKAGRKVLGNHPMFAQIEANVDSKHFKHTVKRVFEESGLNEVPVNLVISNIDQLKSDLNMGDGVVSRAIDQAMAFNANNTDSKQYQDSQESKTEVHYHVEDMQEAIRLEQLRERKKMMKVR